MGFGVGSLMVATRLPVVIWPEPYRDRILALLREGGAFLRGVAVALLVMAGGIAWTTAEPFSLLERVLQVLALFFVVGGMMLLVFRESFRLFAEQIWSDIPSRVLRVGGSAVVAFGGWLIYLSISP